VRLVLTLVLFAAVAPAGAETYKWVDAKGRVNYSNTPPPEAAKAKQVREVEDRMSVYQTDPAYEAYLRQRAAQIAAAQEAEWAERRRYLVAAQASYPSGYQDGTSAYPDYYSGYGYGSYFPAVVGTRNNLRNRVMHHNGGRPVHVSHQRGGGRR